MVAIVDEKGNFIRELPRSQKKNKASNEFTQGPVIILTRKNNQGGTDVLMQKRAPHKLSDSNNVGPWDFTVGGFQQGEEKTILQSAIRESSEELKNAITIDPTRMIQIDSRPVNRDSDSRWVRTMFHYAVSPDEETSLALLLNGNLYEEGDEVESWEWKSLEEIQAEAIKITVTAPISLWSTVLDAFKDISNLGDMLAKDSVMPPGGIDMNAQKMQMNEKGQKIDMLFDQAMMAQFKRGDFSGLTPVIFNITPIANPSLLLGLNQEARSQGSSGNT